MAILFVIAIVISSIILVAAVPAWIAMVATRRGSWRWTALIVALLAGEAVLYLDIIGALLGIGYDGTCPRDWKFPTRGPCPIEEWRSLILWPTPNVSLLPSPTIWWLRALGSSIHLAVFTGLVAWWSRRGVPLLKAR